ncbi:unnamed protein product [Anisakis simplex]|uniref:CRAL-TRIO domain-containing protein n=1 Tax=Anisakis simplex TaxID=6269 RepID=A0A0M3KFV0_ANISI|nr:unnamed protein product [Anisakis simplex]
MLREFTSDDDKQQATLLLGNSPHMLPICNLIKAMRRCSPGFIRLFGYPSCSPVFWFGVLPDLGFELFVKLFKQLTNNTYPWKCASYHLFHMKEEQQKNVSEKKLELPSEYRFDDIHPTSDAKIIEGTDERRVEIMRKMYECLPTVAVRSGDVLKGVGAFALCTFYLPWGKTLSKEVKSILEMRVWQECVSFRS